MDGWVRFYFIPRTWHWCGVSGALVRSCEASRGSSNIQIENDRKMQFFQRTCIDECSHTSPFKINEFSRFGCHVYFKLCIIVYSLLLGQMRSVVVGCAISFHFDLHLFAFATIATVDYTLSFVLYAFYCTNYCYGQMRK